MAAEGSSSDLIQVVSLLGAAAVAVPLFKRLGLDSVLGYLAAGLAIGLYGLALVTDSHSIIHIAEFGVVMFLFVIGLEMKPSHLWGLRRQIFGLGSLQVILCSILLTFVGVLFGFSWAVSFVSATGFVLTSTAIVMQVLGERQELASPRGQRMVSILLFEDLLIVPLLVIVTFRGNFGQTCMRLWRKGYGSTAGEQALRPARSHRRSGTLLAEAACVVSKLIPYRYARRTRYQCTGSCPAGQRAGHPNRGLVPRRPAHPADRRGAICRV